MSQPTPEHLRELAAEIILDHARDIEYLSVSEMLSDQLEGFDYLGDDDQDQITRSVHDLCRKGTITVDFPQVS